MVYLKKLFGNFYIRKNQNIAEKENLDAYVSIDEYWDISNKYLKVVDSLAAAQKRVDSFAESQDSKNPWQPIETAPNREELDLYGSYPKVFADGTEYRYKSDIVTSCISLSDEKVPFWVRILDNDDDTIRYEISKELDGFVPTHWRYNLVPEEYV